MPRKLTQEEADSRNKKFFPEYKVLSSYTNNNTKIKIEHICGHVYEATPAHFWGGRGCPECAKKKKQEKLSKIGEKHFYAELKELDLSVPKNFVYTNNRQSVKVTCKKCGRVQESWITNIIAGHGCASCSAKKQVNVEDFLSKLEEKAPEWELVGSYINAKSSTEFRHKKCGKIMCKQPYNLLSSPDTCKHCKTSFVETNLGDFIASIYSGKIEHNNRELLGGKELDIVLPQERVGFELDGLYYHSDRVLSKKGHNPRRYHLDKTLACAEKGYRLVHIFEDEWLEHREIVGDKIKSILKIPGERVFARNTIAKFISYREAKTFLEKNHIQGSSNCKINIGLYLQDELVAVQQFIKQADWELARYASKIGVQVLGGFSKCFSLFLKTYTPPYVISFADLRWCSSLNNVYEQNGWVKEKILAPDYFYTKQRKRYHKFNFRKQRIKAKYPQIYSDSKTEKEMMQELKFSRIYDCGKIKYKYYN